MNWFILAFTSAVFSAMAAISQKKVLFKIEGLEFSFLVSIVSLIFSLPFIALTNYSTLVPANLFILFLKTIPGTAAFFLVMLSLKNLEISKALPLLALTPGLVAIFAFIILKDELTLTETGGIVLLFIGTYLIETRPGQKIFDPFTTLIKSKKHHYVLGALLLFTLTSIIDRWLLGRYKLMPEAFMGFQQLFMAFNFLAVIFFIKKKPLHVIRSIDTSVWKWIVLIALLTIVYRYTEILAVRSASVALVLAVKRISVFIAVVIGGRLFKESSLLLRAAATVIIIVGLFVIAG
ncbi:MAG TPA: DMT family transporter [Ignavibacteriales bacterium]|nr:DMT family transporter [Ignavibacteriales bacterium]